MTNWEDIFVTYYLYVSRKTLALYSICEELSKFEERKIPQKQGQKTQTTKEDISNENGP